MGVYAFYCSFSIKQRNLNNFEHPVAKRSKRIKVTTIRKAN